MRAVADLDARLARRAIIGVEQSRSAAPHFARQSAPELVSAVHFHGLAPVARLEAHALLAHPLERRVTVVDERLDEIGITAVLREPADIFEIVLPQVLAEIRARDLLARQIGNDLEQVFDAAIRGAHLPRRITRIAARVLRVGGFQHDHLRAVLPRRERRGHGRIAGADDDYVIITRHASLHLDVGRDDHVAVLSDLRADVVPELLRCRGRELHALLVEPLDHVGLLQHRAHRLV